MKQPSRGFTLIELMMVVAIIAVVAAIAIPSYQQYAARSRWSQNLVSIANLKQSLSQCLANNNSVVALCNSAERLVEQGFVRPDFQLPTPAYAAKPVAIAPENAAIVITGDARAGSCVVSLVPETDGSAAAIVWRAVNGSGCNRSVTGVGT